MTRRLLARVWLTLALTVAATTALAPPASADRRMDRSGGGLGSPPSKPDTWSPSETSATVVQPDGRYELRGDGVGTPYHWVWVPKAAPPGPPVGSTTYGPAEGLPARAR